MVIQVLNALCAGVFLLEPLLCVVWLVAKAKKRFVNFEWVTGRDVEIGSLTSTAGAVNIPALESLELLIRHLWRHRKSISRPRNP